MIDNERLAVIETKVDGLTALVTEHAKEVKGVIEKHDNRLRALERFRNIIIGAGLVVSGGVTTFWKSITNIGA